MGLIYFLSGLVKIYKDKALKWLMSTFLVAYSFMLIISGMEWFFYPQKGAKIISFYIVNPVMLEHYLELRKIIATDQNPNIGARLLMIGIIIIFSLMINQKITLYRLILVISLYCALMMQHLKQG